MSHLWDRGRAQGQRTKNRVGFAPSQPVSCTHASAAQSPRLLPPRAQLPFLLPPLTSHTLLATFPTGTFCHRLLPALATNSQGETEGRFLGYFRSSHLLALFFNTAYSKGIWGQPQMQEGGPDASFQRKRGFQGSPPPSHPPSHSPVIPPQLPSPSVFSFPPESQFPHL